jgi:UrcA family protein
MNNAKIRTIRAITISAAAALGLGAAGAIAGTPATEFVADGVISYVVRFPDLDLSKTDGAAVLYRRLDQAARVVCEPLQNSDRVHESRYRACLVQAVDNAVAGIDRPLLWQYHQARTNKGDKAPLAQVANAN